jgi:uncharacterized OB-fold protein
VSWTWVAQPREKQPFDRPFAYALIRLDGADTALLHVVDTDDETRLAAGARVTARFADDPQGGIRDLACFELEAS